MNNPGLLNSTAEATRALAETGGKAMDLAHSLGRVVKGPVEQIVGMMSDKLVFMRWERQLALEDKAKRVMESRGLSEPTRVLPANFAFPLLTHAFLEEDDELQEIWARLLVNAGNASTPLELRTAYVEILSNMSGFDVKNLESLARAAKRGPRVTPVPPFIETHRLPESAKIQDDTSGPVPSVSRELGISLSNLNRLGCISPAYGFGGMANFGLVTVTDLGMAMYEACA